MYPGTKLGCVGNARVGTTYPRMSRKCTLPGTSQPLDVFSGAFSLLAGQVIGFQLEDTLPDVMMREALMTAAFAGQPLGRPYWCPAAAVPRLEAYMVQGFRRR